MCCWLSIQVKVSDMKFYYMEDDGGSPLTLPVHPEIQSAIRRFVKYLEDNYGIKAQKVNLILVLLDILEIIMNVLS